MRARTASAVLLAALAGGAAFAAPPRDPADAARALDDPRWEERRRAEDDLLAMGTEALGAPPEEGKAKLEAWDTALAAAERTGGPGAAEAVGRVLRRLEERLDDDDVRRVPRLLRARLERFVPHLVVTAAAPGLRAFDESEGDAWRVAAETVRHLLPEARAALVDLVRTTRDPRRLAGAMVPWGEEREPEEADFLAAIGETWDAAPDRIVAAARFGTAGPRQPLATIALALALTGRASDLPRLRRFLDLDVIGAFGADLRSRLALRGQGDLGLGEFLERVEAGEASAEEEAEAARRAAAAGVPWLARLLARRALFLAPAHEGARATLAAADEALGLRATALADAGRPREDGVADDPESAATDAALRAGRLSQRLLHRLEAGRDRRTGLAPVAIGDGFLVAGTTRGWVNLVDADTGRVRSSASTSVPRLPRGLAVARGVVAAISARGGVFYWEPTPQGLLRAGIATGPFAAVAGGKDGAFWFVGANRTLHRADGPGEPTPVPGLAPVPGWVASSIGVLDDGAILLAGGGQVLRFDPATGASTTLAEGEDGALRAAPFGRGAVVARGDTFDVLSETGERTGGGRLGEGTRITGVAGDPAAGAVYLATASSFLAVGAKDGAILWSEDVEGSANPAVGRGLVAVSAGLGTDEGGDNRLDRTISVLRAATGGRDPFAADARVKAVEAAVTAARDDLRSIARAILDPIAGWLTPSERWAADQALRELPGRREDLDGGATGTGR